MSVASLLEPGRTQLVKNTGMYRNHNYVIPEGGSSPSTPWGEVTPRCQIPGYPQVGTVIPWGEVT